VSPIIEQPAMAKVIDVTEEGSDARTIWLAHSMPFEPGQFVMLWAPRLGEKPYTLSFVEPDRVAVTVSTRGKFSQHLMNLKPGDQIGIRGPYGKGFTIRDSGVIVAGGCGVAPLAPLKTRLPETPIIVGAQTADALMLNQCFSDMEICTDDGSCGHKGFPTDLLRPRLESGEIKIVYTCGPEVMMKAVFDMCEEFQVECEAGLERYMKCGFGVCGQCTCDDQLVCQDGPVFNSAELRKMKSFGKTAKLKSGKRVSVQEYASWRSC